jgi:hypothetical protein
MNKGLKRGIVGVAVAAMLLVPSAAWALPRLGRVRAAAPAARGQLTADRAAVLRARITLVLERRKLRFDRASFRIGNQITRLGNLASRVESSGGDVSGVRDQLTQATAALDAAKGAEAQAVTAFKAVPDASDKRAAFAEARRIGVQAATKLAEARRLTRAAAASLRTVVSGLKGTSSS